jgi:hypothetical protein
MQEAIQNLVDRMFGGRAERLLWTLIKMRELDKAILERLKRARYQERAK